MEKEFLEKYSANMYPHLLEKPGDKRRSRYREVFSINSDEPDVTGTMARHQEFVNMMTVLAAESALGEITTDLVSSVRLRAGV